MNYVDDPTNQPFGPTEISHLDGVKWLDAPVPRRFHRCRAQSRGWFNYFDLIERCACGAYRMDGRKWRHRNSRKR